MAKLIRLLNPFASTLRRDVVLLTVSGLFRAFCLWLVLVTLNKRFVGSTFEVGQYTLALAIATTISCFTTMGLRGVMVSEPTERIDFPAYFNFRLLSSVPLLLITAIVAFAGNYGAGTTLVIMIIGLDKAVYGISELLAGVFQRHERLHYRAISMGLTGLLTLAAAVTVLSLTPNLTLALAVMVVFHALGVLLYDMRCARRFQPLRGPLSAKSLWQLLKTSYPFAILGGILALSAQQGHFITAFYGKEEMVGIYASQMYVITGISVAVEAIAHSVFPRQVRILREKGAGAFLAISFKAMAITSSIGLAVLAGSLLFGRWFCLTFYSPEVAEHVGVLWLLALSAPFSYNIPVLMMCLTTLRKFWLPVIAYAAQLVAGLIFGVLLIPSYGVEGMAGAMSIAIFLCFLLSLILALRESSARRQQEVAPDVANKLIQ